MYMPDTQEATWSGERPSMPQVSSAHASSACRRSTSSACEVGSCHMRLTRLPEVGETNVIRSRFAGCAW